MNIESAKNYVESVCTMLADDHNISIDMRWESMIDNPVDNQPAIDYTLVVKTNNDASRVKKIHFHEEQLMHCKSEHETLRISHHMLNLFNKHTI